MRYSPVLQASLDHPDAHFVFQSVAEQYLAQARGSYERVESLTDAPREAQVVWRLWCFLAEVGSNSVCDYLSNHCPGFVRLREVHAALLLTKADEMRALLENGIRSAYEHHYGEFREHPGAKDWAAAFARTLLLSDDQLNSLSTGGANPACREVVAAYIRANRRAR